MADTTASAATPRPPQSPPENRTENPTLTWTPVRGMVLLSIFNFVMRIVTLGIYHFWGKTEERRRIWSGIRLNSEPLQYNGAGLELFIGLLLVFGAIFLPMFLITSTTFFVFGPQSQMNTILSVLLYAATFFLIGAGYYRAQRYRLSRTTWRGIRGGLDGDGWDYAITYFWTTLLIPLTLGWIMPWRTVKLQSLVSNRMRFGDRYFTFQASPAYLYKRYTFVWFGTLVLVLLTFTLGGIYIYSTRGIGPQLGNYYVNSTEIAVLFAIAAVSYLIYLIISSWYRAQTFNYFANQTAYDGATFTGTMRASSLAWLSASNYLMVLMTLGIMAPVAQMRSARYMVQSLAFDAPVDFDTIAQTAADEKQMGEGIAQAFDVDAF